MARPCALVTTNIQMYYHGMGLYSHCSTVTLYILHCIGGFHTLYDQPLGHSARVFITQRGRSLLEVLLRFIKSNEDEPGDIASSSMNTPHHSLVIMSPMVTITKLLSSVILQSTRSRVS